MLPSDADWAILTVDVPALGVDVPDAVVVVVVAASAVGEVAFAAVAVAGGFVGATVALAFFATAVAVLSALLVPLLHPAAKTAPTSKTMKPTARYPRVHREVRIMGLLLFIATGSGFELDFQGHCVPLRLQLE
jgi:hypothetical protein